MSQQMISVESMKEHSALYYSQSIVHQLPEYWTVVNAVDDTKVDGAGSVKKVIKRAVTVATMSRLVSNHSNLDNNVHSSHERPKDLKGINQSHKTVE